MAFLKKVLALMIVLALVFAGFVVYWEQQPIIPPEQPGIDFSIKPGSAVKSAAQQIVAAGVPMNPHLFVLLARISGKSAKMKAGNYVLKPGTTPLHLISQLVRGEFAQEAISIIEGWTFKQMREEINTHPALKHDTAQMSDQELLALITTEFKNPEGLFFPDTYMFATGASDLQIYRQAHAVLMKRLNEAWAARNPTLPYKTPYEALTMASIVEKETGQSSERSMVAAVFVNRLKLGMLLQTDPTVIYGMGDKYKGKIHKSDLERDTPYNTYTRAGLPPTPIALPGGAALAATLNPATTDVLYFVARKDGSSQFSSNLNDHNRAVNKYQR
ncbi:MAG TPA: endolytic transglycosylase MltG [Burkholderiaceae bacterium]